jgi:predicted amidohydrolase
MLFRVIVAALELPVRFGDVAGALSAIERVVTGAGVDLVVLPETALTGYVSEDGDFDLTRFAEPLDGPTASALSTLARRTGTAIAGPLVEREGDALFNALVLFARDGALLGHYRKRHPWYPETWATPGDRGTPVLSVGDLRVVPAVCFDIHFVAEDAPMALDSADVLLFPSAWVEDRGDERARILPALARRFGVAVVHANWGVGSTPRVRGQGGSRIVDREGEIVASARVVAEPQLVRATIPPS